jgi:hypothetical protein
MGITRLLSQVSLILLSFIGIAPMISQIGLIFPSSCAQVLAYLCEHRPGFIWFHFVRRSWLTFASNALVSFGFILPSFCAQVLAYLCEQGPGSPL